MIDKLTLAVRDMDEMCAFYAGVLGASFERIEMFERTLYTATVDGVDLLLCPADLAGVEAETNTVQVRFVVADVDAAYQAGLMQGGVHLTEPEQSEGRRHASLRDPDGNSLELIAPQD
jgi:predicted enzyme related to lactoylglutathione lyase